MSHSLSVAVFADVVIAGEPYQYVGGAANTVPMSEAPDAVRRAREYIQMRISQALERKEEFNEVLSAAYLERQRMAVSALFLGGHISFTAGSSTATTRSDSAL